MTAPAKLAGFAAVLGLLFAGGAVAGGAIGPDGERARAADPHGHGGEASEHHTAMAGAYPVRGLAVSDRGLRVVVDDAELTPGRAENVRFRIVDVRGATVRDFAVEHTKRMHLIVVRRDMAGFQHLHPEQAADGAWSAEVRLAEPGSYRLFADFSRGGEAHTLATDLRADGDADLRPLAPVAAEAVSDGGYDVRLDSGPARAGRESELRFTVAKDGETVHTEPYLGAGGHLVALRDGDLAFLHVHPADDHEPQQMRPEHDDAVAFRATFPTEGRYRLFLQFKHEGRVQTVAFTQEVSR